MEIAKIIVEVEGMVKYMDERGLKTDEKFAVLDATKGLLSAVIAAETLQTMTAQYLRKV